MTTAADRLCASCGRVLSVYNAETTCAPCQETERARWLASLRAEAAEEALTERIMDALPATLDELADAFPEVNRRQIGKALQGLLRQSRIHGTGRRGGGKRGSLRVYHPGASQDRAA